MRALNAAAMGLAMALSNPAAAEQDAARQTHPYLGMWVTDDGRVRHELLPNGRYDEARGRRESAYRGRYEVTGNHIEYWDDTGFTADGDFVDADTLHHGGMVLRRRVQPSRAPSPP
jgi:hypothetical protein